MSIAIFIAALAALAGAALVALGLTAHRRRASAVDDDDHHDHHEHHHHHGHHERHDHAAHDHRDSRPDISRAAQDMAAYEASFRLDRPSDPHLAGSTSTYDGSRRSSPAFAAGTIDQRGHAVAGGDDAAGMVGKASRRSNSALAAGTIDQRGEVAGGGASAAAGGRDSKVILDVDDPPRPALAVGSQPVVPLPHASVMVSPAPLPVDERSEASKAHRVGDRLRILIVDDDAMSARMVARLLREHDTVVTTGSAALAALTVDDNYDAILCSLTMTSMPGIAFASVVAANHPALHPRIVFLAGAATTQETQRLLALSDVRWVSKPVQYAPLAICLSEVVAAARRAELASRREPRATSAAG